MQGVHYKGSSSSPPWREREGRDTVDSPAPGQGLHQTRLETIDLRSACFSFRRLPKDKNKAHRRASCSLMKPGSTPVHSWGPGYGCGAGWALKPVDRGSHAWYSHHSGRCGRLILERASPALISESALLRVTQARAYEVRPATRHHRPQEHVVLGPAPAPRTWAGSKSALRTWPRPRKRRCFVKSFICRIRWTGSRMNICFCFVFCFWAT